MSKETPLVTLSALEEERFGIRTAKSSRMNLEEIPEALHFCRENQVKLLIVRCGAEGLSAVQEMERRGFLLMDTVIRFSFDLRKKPIPARSSEILVREFRQGEDQVIRKIAAAAYKGYGGHYHADSMLDRDKCDEVYSDWAYRCCISHDPSSCVLVAELSGKAAGFGSMRVNDQQEGEGLLFAVAPACQGMGVYRQITIQCLQWCAARGLDRMVIVTQVTNLVSQKVWTRLGFEASQAYYTFHKWFDGDEKE